jgi:hypothetical protein
MRLSHFSTPDAVVIAALNFTCAALTFTVAPVTLTSPGAVISTPLGVNRIRVPPAAVISTLDPWS